MRIHHAIGVVLANAEGPRKTGLIPLFKERADLPAKPSMPRQRRVTGRNIVYLFFGEIVAHAGDMTLEPALGNPSRCGIGGDPVEEQDVRIRRHMRHDWDDDCPAHHPQDAKADPAQEDDKHGRGRVLKVAKRER